MSKYLEILNRKYVLGLISKNNLDAEKLRLYKSLTLRI